MTNTRPASATHHAARRTGPTRRLNGDIDANIHQSIKIAAAVEDDSMVAIAEDVLSMYVAIKATGVEINGKNRAKVLASVVRAWQAVESTRAPGLPLAPPVQIVTN